MDNKETKVLGEIEQLLQSISREGKGISLIKMIGYIEVIKSTMILAGSMKGIKKNLLN